MSPGTVFTAFFTPAATGSSAVIAGMMRPPDFLRYLFRSPMHELQAGTRLPQKPGYEHLQVQVGGGMTSLRLRFPRPLSKFDCALVSVFASNSVQQLVLAALPVTA